MRIILHMGQSKTGSTALQVSLNAASQGLARLGVLYPRWGNGTAAHHLLLALIGCEAHLSPTILDQVGGLQGAKAAARVAWQSTRAQVLRDRPRVLVLSSENLIHHPDAAAKARLKAILSELSGDILPVIYVREPVGHYRARLQEVCKRSDAPVPPGDRNLRQAVLDIETVFGRRPAFVPFDRTSLRGGDSVQDFASRFLGPDVTPKDIRSRSSNVGLSAEALVLLAQMRAGAWQGRRSARKLEGLTPFLRDLDRSDPPASPFTLLPEVAEAALRASTGFRWLVETGRLEAADADLTRIDGTPPPDWMTTAPPTALFQHDPARLRRLQAAVDDHLSRNRIRPDPSDKPIPRIRDLLLRFLLGHLASDQDRKTGATSDRSQSVRQPSQGDLNEDHSTAGKLDTGAGDRPWPGSGPDH